MRTGLITCLAAVLALACAHAEPAGETAAPSEADRADGTVVIQPDADADRYLTSGYVGPLPEPGALLALSIGQLARDDALEAFGAWFRGGAHVEAPGAARRGVRVVVLPTAIDAAGPGLEPAIQLRIHVAVLDPSGRPAWEETLSGGSWSGPLWFRRGVRYPEPNQRLHDAVARLVERAAADAATHARTSATAAGSSPAAPGSGNGRG